jgi:predicted metal-dependent TIM-barrel fold hydrolase
MTPRIFDHHIHMDGRSASDYESMALCGVSRVLVPCSFTGEPKSCRRGFAARFDRLLVLERDRAAQFGIELFAGLSVNAADVGDDAAALEAVDEVEQRLGHPCVKAVGELALKTFSDVERSLFVRQLALAERYDLPAVVEASPDPAVFKRLVGELQTAISAGVVAAGRVCLIDLDAEKLDLARGLGLGRYGIAAAPRLDGPFVLHRKLDHREVAALVDRYGVERVMLNSGLHFGNSDAICLPRVLLRLRLAGMDEITIQRLSYENASTFFLGTPGGRI